MNELLLINKDKNYTSRDVVNIISKKFNTKKVGHFGTLDPLATGLLVIGIGKYTKIQKLFPKEDKTYEVEVLVGTSTTTYDITGKIVCNKEIIVNKYYLINSLLSFEKTYMQEVPIYSAVKVNGKRLYEYARNNEEVVLPKKEVILLKKEMEKLEKNLGGIKEMKELPGVMFIVDPKKERIGILEAKKLGIPVIGLIDTNCNPEDVDYAIPGNDDAIRAVKLIADCMANAVIEGRQGESMDVEVVEEQVAEEEPQSMEEVVETAEEN